MSSSTRMVGVTRSACARHTKEGSRGKGIRISAANAFFRSFAERVNITRAIITMAAAQRKAAISTLWKLRLVSIIHSFYFDFFHPIKHYLIYCFLFFFHNILLNFSDTSRLMELTTVALNTHPHLSGVRIFYYKF